jgi:hypothetical protein
VDDQGRLVLSNNPFNNEVIKMLPWFRTRVGAHVRSNGNVPVHFRSPQFTAHPVVTFPVKQVHDGLPHEAIIRQSCQYLARLLRTNAVPRRPLYMHRPACGPVPLQLWPKMVKPLLEKYLPKDVVLVTPPVKARGAKVGV